MILTDKEDFEKSILSGKEIKTKTIFYTDELECIEADGSKVEAENNECLKPGTPYYRNNELIGVVVASNVYVNGGFKTIVMALKSEDEKMTWDEAVAFYENNSDGWRLPTKEEQALMIANIEEINQGLEKCDGDPIIGVFWSSSEHYGYDAWYSGFSSDYGLHTNYCHKDSSDEVRPVLAF